MIFFAISEAVSRADLLCVAVTCVESSSEPPPKTCRASLWCRSPVHQVVTTGVERTSFVFFYYPNFEATLPAAIGGAADMSGEPLNKKHTEILKVFHLIRQIVI